MAFNKKINDIQEIIFDILLYFSYFLIIISFLGFSKTAPTFLENIDYYIRVYVCLFLIWRFNPLRNVKQFTDLDRKIAFSAGMLIITTTALNQYILYVKQTFKQKIKKIL